MSQELTHIGLIGYGNVGSHLAHLLARQPGISLTVYRRKAPENDSTGIGLHFTSNMEDLNGADVIIVAVRDEAIVPVIEQMRDQLTGDEVVLHCAGSIASDVTAPYFRHYGVLYPLQTFSKDKSLDYNAIPVFITGSDDDTSGRIKRLARFISPIIQEINDDQRMALHIAAVFSCNYTNALYAIAHRICKDHQLPFNHLLPLIRETADKINEMTPEEAQTGPAVRGDLVVTGKHEKYLVGYRNDYAELYRRLADFIQSNIKT